MDGWKTAFLLGWPIFERYMLGSVPLSAVFWVLGAFWSGSFLATSLRNVSEKGLPRAMFLGVFSDMKPEVVRKKFRCVFFLGGDLIDCKETEGIQRWLKRWKAMTAPAMIGQFFPRSFWDLLVCISKKRGFLWYLRKLQHTPGTYMQILNHLFLKESLPH